MDWNAKILFDIFVVSFEGENPTYLLAGICGWITQAIRANVINVLLHSCTHFISFFTSDIDTDGTLTSAAFLKALKEYIM